MLEVQTELWKSIKQKQTKTSLFEEAWKSPLQKNTGLMLCEESSRFSEKTAS